MPTIVALFSMGILPKLPGRLLSLRQVRMNFAIVSATSDEAQALICRQE